MKTTIALLLCICSVGLQAQSSQEVRVKAGHSMNEYFPSETRYRFAQFQEGKIYYQDGRVTESHPFNYDQVSGAILGIQPEGDTVLIIDSHIKQVIIAKIVMYQVADNQFAEVISSADEIKLAVNSKWIIKRREQIENNGYTASLDQTKSTYQQPNIAWNFFFGKRLYNQDVILTQRTSFYMLTKDDVNKASKAKILKKFPTYKAQLEKYMQESKTDMNSRKDLEQLFGYLNSLGD